MKRIGARRRVHDGGELDAEKVRRLFHYDPETGALTYARPVHPFKVGDTVGTVHKKSGYRVLTVNGRFYHAARVIWLHMTGTWPDGLVDHINRVRTDNKWSNLRVVSRAQNAMNVSRRKDNKSGVTGVHFHKKSGRWVAEIGQKYIGLFATKDEAAAVRKAAAEQQYGEYAGEP